MNSSYICNCGCSLVFKVVGNMRGCLIQMTPYSFIVEDIIVGDRWSNHIEHLRTWGEFKNKIISKNENLHNNINNNNNNNYPNVWLHLYNQYINRNVFENLHPETGLQFIYIN